MRVKLRQVGNSLTMTVPKAIASDLHLVAGEEVELTLERDSFVVKPAQTSWDRLLEHVRKQAQERGLDNRDIGKALAASRDRRRLFPDTRRKQS